MWKIYNESFILTLTWLNKFINHDNEYWYIGSILFKSVIQKNNTEECLDTGI